MYGDVHALCKHIYPACLANAQGIFSAQVNTNKASCVSKNRYHVALVIYLATCILYA